MERSNAVTAGRRHPRRRSEHLVEDLLDAAAIEFASHGYDGASTRRIADRAGAHQPQINYHFHSKEHLWRATVTRLFEMMQHQLRVPVEATGPVGTFSDAIRRFLRFSSARPELNRIINLEATSPSSRLDWLVATHLDPLHQAVGSAWAALRASGEGADLTGDEVWELVTSYGALHFANAPMLSRLRTGAGGDPPAGPPERGPSDPAIDPAIDPATEAHADSVLRMLFPDRVPGPR